MIEHETKTIKETEQFPTELDLKRILSVRALHFPKGDELKLQHLESGRLGEEKVFEFLQKYGKEHWIAIRNLWLDYNHTFEIDLLVMTNNCVYSFEIKHYTGNFTYENGLCTLRNQPIEADPIQQARRNFVRMNKIFQSYSSPFQFKSIVIFVSDLNQVHIKSPIDDIIILQLTDLYEFVKQMIREESARYPKAISHTDIIEHLSQFEVTHPYLPDPISTEIMQNLRPGIHCARCHSFELESSKNYFICSCGLHEPREEAIVRTVCDYCTLNYDKPFKASDIMKFIGGYASRSLIIKVVANHFEQSLKNRFTVYKSVKLPYSKIYSKFDIKLPVKYYSNRSRIQEIIIEN